MILFLGALAVTATVLAQRERPTEAPPPGGQGATETPGDGDSDGDGDGDGDGAIDLERSVVAYASGFSKDDPYRRPARTERQAVAGGVGLLLDGKEAEAEKRFADVGFTVRTLTDRVSGRRYAEIADRSEDVGAARGWGRVYVDLSTSARWTVQIPHPVADSRTERLGVAVLRDTPGGVLVLAGAHRDAGDGGAADVAHREDSVFHAVCDELARRGLPGLQLHGFANDSAPEYDVIASLGQAKKGRTEGRALAKALRAHDLDVCRAWARSCPLSGRTNVQGRSAAERGVPFLHIEMNRDVREGGEPAARVVGAMGRVTGGWA